MSKSKRSLVIGILIGVMLTSLLGTASALTGKQTIEVNYNNIKLYVDSIPVTPKDAAGQVVEPFVYNGTTYLPVRAVAEALGKDVTWDGATQSVYIGKAPGQVKYFYDVVPSYQRSGTYDEYSVTKNTGRSFSMAGVPYSKGVKFYTGASAYHNLNGQYSTLTAVAGCIDNSKGAVSINFYSDGRLIREVHLSSDELPQNISVDVSGVLQLKIEVVRISGSGYFGLGNAMIE